MSEFLIRPHHMLCLQFFEGHGYSDGFVENMQKVKEYLEKENPIVHIHEGVDDICRSCPKNQGKNCINEENVLGHDRRVYSEVKETVGTDNDWDTITKAIKKEIIESGKMPEVCGECTWSSICFK